MREHNKTRGTKALLVEVTADLLDAFRAMVKSRKESARDHIEYMMRRHIANPPAPEDVPRVSPRGRGRPKTDG
jgi:hypothetical protein